MSSRGRGRGRGRGGYGGGAYRPGKQLSWDPFPEIEDLGTATGFNERLALAKWYSKLHSYWRASPYYYEGAKESSQGANGEEIERFSDMVASKTKAKPPLSHFIKMEQGYVPAELARGEKRRPTKQVRWTPDAGSDKLDLLEKLENKYKDMDEKKDVEDEEDNDKSSDHEEPEYSTDGDYNQNEDFDDDEDDYNMAEDDNDEPSYI